MRRAGFGLLASALVTALLTGSCASAPPRPPPMPPMPPPSCGALLPLLTVGGSTSQRSIYGQLNGNQLLFFAGLAIDADGAPNAYHPIDEYGLDALANAGRPGHWWGIATDDNGEPIRQGWNDPFPGFYVSMTSLTDPDIDNPGSPQRYVDARLVPYFVLPGGSRAAKVLKDAGAKLGDLAIVYNVRTRKMAGAVWADAGPSDKLGEGSIRLAEMLGYDNTSPRTGGTFAAENVFVVFPGTSLGFPRDLTRMEQGTNDLLLLWGGQARLNACAAQLGGR